MEVLFFLNSAEVSRHIEIPDVQCTSPDLTDFVGGGNCYIKGKKVVLGGYSSEYDALTVKAAKIFAEMLRDRLKEDYGIETEGILAFPDNMHLNKFWTEKRWKKSSRSEIIIPKTGLPQPAYQI